MQDQLNGKTLRDLCLLATEQAAQTIQSITLSPTIKTALLKEVPAMEQSTNIYMSKFLDIKIKADASLPSNVFVVNQADGTSKIFAIERNNLVPVQSLDNMKYVRA